MTIASSLSYHSIFDSLHTETPGRTMSSTTAESTVPLAEYLWRRIHSIGIEHVFGVPGDFNCKLATIKSLPMESA